MPAILRSIKLDEIPYFEHWCSMISLSVDWDDPLCQQTAGGLRIRMQHDTPSSGMAILVSPDAEYPRWHRAYRLGIWFVRSPCPIADLPALGARLTSLRMENIYLAALLETDVPALDVLRTLQIDFHASWEAEHAAVVLPPDWDPASDDCVSCAALETLTLFAFDAPVELESQEVAYLGRALCQSARAKADRATLELVGIDFKRPAASDLLADGFSSVRECAFSGSEAPAERDQAWCEERWDEG
ncbi:hypothetical protein AURDEDRAFT_164922 [Auricularia subglabra TFB-10046 SS5]|nr:hypothetical protein AURDEDRAFT_164922 [Auricularia subglabra TFB-10046 SS5]